MSNKETAKLRTQAKIRCQVKKAVRAIRAANDLETAEAIYRTVFDKIKIWRKSKSLSEETFQIYFEILDNAIIE